MENKTHISRTITGNNNRDRYDAEVKKILGNKLVLAWIMKYSVGEFMDYAIDEIQECIEGTPEIATVNVAPGHQPEAISGLPNEDKVPGEGMITYDIRFFAITRDKERVKLILNVEAQQRFQPGYDLVTRAIFYCARMLSSQLDTEFTPRNYDDIKKVYSIFICMDCPAYAEYTITRYHMTKDEIYGHIAKNQRYDLLEAIMICLGKEERKDKGNKLHGFLSTLLSSTLSPQEKEDILEDEYGVEMTVDIEGGLKEMCNLSGLIEERAIKQGEEKGRHSERIATIQKMIQNGYSKKFILGFNYTTEEYAEAEAELCQLV